MIKKTWTGILGLAVMAVAVQAGVILEDDFSSGSFTHKVRVYEVDIDNGWLSPMQTGVVTSEWEVVSGQMVNSATTPGNYPTNMPAEGPLVQVVSTTETNAVLEVVFDYNVASGDQLYVHLWGLDGTYDMDAQWFANHQGGNGGLNPAENSDDGVIKYNLTDGSVATASTPIPALTGSGTYSNSFNIAGLGIAGVNNTADFEYILVGFAKEEDGTAGTTWIDNLSISAVEGAAGAFQENPVFPNENVLVSQLDYNNTGSVRWTGASGGVNSGLGQSFEFGTAQTLRAITFQKGGSVAFPSSGTHELKLWIGEYDSKTDTNSHTTGTTLYTEIFDVAGQAFIDGSFYTINLGSDLSLSAGVEYAFELAFSTLDATHTFNINRYYEGAGLTDTYADGTIVYKQNIDGGVPFVSQLNEPENDITFGLHSATVGTYAYLDADPDEISEVFDSTAVSLVTGSVDVVFNSATNMDITISISDQSHLGAFSVLSTTPQTLTVPMTPTTLEFEFDNTVATLAAGQTATGLATIAWSETGGGASGSTVVPLSATAAFPADQINSFNGSGDGVSWNDPDNWQLDRVPGTLGADRAIIQNGGSVNVSSDFAGAFVWETTVRNSSTLNIAADFTGGDEMYIGHNAGHYGLVNQTAGDADTTFLKLGDDGATSVSNSVYSLTGGTLIADDGDLTATGILDINGGVFTINEVASAGLLTINGDGLIQLQSGTFDRTGTAGGDAMIVKPDITISGGAVNLTGQNYLNGTTTIQGDGASITIQRLNSNPSNTGDYVFEMGATGVSGIANTSWMNLGSVSITVDGTAYTGGSATFTLFDTVNLSTTSTAVSVTGFAAGYTAVVTQDQGVDEVTLTITQGGYAGWANDYGVGASTNNPDGDALNNLYEYGLGGDPTNSADIGLDSALVSGAGYIDYVHARRVAATNEISYALALTENLVVGSWTTNTGYTVEGYGPVVDYGPGAGEFDTVTNRIITTGKTAEFIDLVIEELP